MRGATILLKQFLGAVVLCGFFEVGDFGLSLFLEVFKVGLLAVDAPVEEKTEDCTDGVYEDRCANKTTVVRERPIMRSQNQRYYKGV